MITASILAALLALVTLACAFIATAAAHEGQPIVAAILLVAASAGCGLTALYVVRIIEMVAS